MKHKRRVKIVNIPFIDISNTNCWLVNLLPFGDNSTIEEIKRFQAECIKHSVFGMGWDCLYANSPVYTELDETEKEKHIKVCENCKEKKCPVSDEILKRYLKVKPGDYVITRLKNAHYYIGKVITKAFYSYGKEKIEHLSWCCKVEKWIEYENESMIPSEILGRFSQRNHSTIEKIAAYRTKLLLISTYEKKIDEKERLFNVPTLHITQNNFCRCLNYTELEDLVYLYIYRKHKDENYLCFPSSAKINRAKFEFSFISSNNEMKPISCQVKNQEYIEIENYVNEPSYRLIYLFSGKWCQKNVDEFRKQYADSNIVFISPLELYGLFADYLTYSDKSDFYITDKKAENNILSDISKFTQKYNFKKINKSFCYRNKELNKKQIKYDETEDWICFSSDDLFYSKEFNALILSGNVDKEIIEYIKSIIN